MSLASAVEIELSPPCVKIWQTVYQIVLLRDASSGFELALRVYINRSTCRYFGGKAVESVSQIWGIQWAR